MQLDQSNEIYFCQNFDIELKDNVITKVLELMDIYNENPENSPIKISKCCSYESGFIMILTSEMKEAIEMQNSNYANLLQYHGSRSFRFMEDRNKVVGLRCKDNLRYWTTYEKNLLKKIVEDAITMIN